MNFSQDCVDIVKHYEGFSPKAYVCPAGVLTIGYGHTKGVTQGQTITEEDAEKLLKEDMELTSLQVDQLLDQYNIEVSQAQFDALVSFAYNVGMGNLKSSTLLKKLKQGDYNGAGAEFMRWNKAAGKVLDGLTKRRRTEALLFGGEGVNFI